MFSMVLVMLLSVTKSGGWLGSGRLADGIDFLTEVVVGFFAGDFGFAFALVAFFAGAFFAVGFFATGFFFAMILLLNVLCKFPYGNFLLSNCPLYIASPLNTYATHFR